MNGLGLSAEQIAARRKYIQAGDAARIMSGEWRSVWREKKGLAEGEDLSGVLPVQLGSMTEPFNLAWAERTTGREINYYSGNPLMRGIWRLLHGHDSAALGFYANMYEEELQISEAYPWMACNLDGMTTTPQGNRCVIDAKHLGQAYEQEVLRYTAAGTHQATVMGCDWWALSCLIGNRKHEVIYQEIDALYQASLIAKEREFWGYVTRGEEPEDRVEPVAPPKPQPKRREINLDLTPAAERPNWSGEFARLARSFAETDGAAKLHAITRREMAELVPDDVGLVQLGLVRLKRDGRGVTISLEKAGC
jgi:hypothetical protein